MQFAFLQEYLVWAWSHPTATGLLVGLEHGEIRLLDAFRLDVTSPVPHGLSRREMFEISVILITLVLHSRSTHSYYQQQFAFPYT